MGSMVAGNMTLRQLLADVELPGVQLPEEWVDTLISGVTLDSRSVRPGDLFIAVPGTVADGRKFIPQALQSGAAVVLAEAGGGIDRQDRVIEIEGLLHKASAIAASFYGDPSRSISMTGVTGTNGKTTCTQLLAQLFGFLEQTSGVLGTLGYGVVKPDTSTLISTGMTTPDAVAVQAILAELKELGVRQVAMEVSSHSLTQGRVEAVHFDTAIFTNLSQDHLDYHGTMDAYSDAKARLFSYPGIRCAIINVDDAMGARLSAELRDDIELYRYSLKDTHAEIHASGIELAAGGITAEVKTPWGSGQLKSSLLGEFNLSNLLAIIAAACMQGFALEDVLAAVPKLQPIPGRMEQVVPKGRPQIVVDYAHTPDALKQVLLALRMHCEGKLWCVFGCGGDRDQGKRPLMGEVASQLADHVIVTSDNPRGESAIAIIDAIVAGTDGRAKIRVDRAEAIEYAVVRAALEDTVLLAGKGHETYQVIGETRLPFSDITQARLALRRRGD
ncbi:MAG: UDP-N-acetylmuramoyl-L-alanyl-D-glutamate--2,6-diaminopimelate ligase [Porticoccaceae bacterium]